MTAKNQKLRSKKTRRKVEDLDSTEQNSKKSIWKRVGVSVLVFVFLLIGLGVYSIFPARSAYANALQIREEVGVLQAAVEAQDIPAAKESVNTLVESIDSLNKDLGRLTWLRAVPYVGTQMKAAQKLGKGGQYSLEALQIGFNQADAILEPLGTDITEVQFNNLTTEDKGEILQALQNSAPELGKAQGLLELAQEEFDEIPERGLHPEVAEVVGLLEENFEPGTKMLKEVIVLAEFLPKLAGYPETQTYFMLFQNNTELRPAGGFIGSYGVFNITNAEIESFSTHDVYSLDSNSDISEEPPWQIRKFAAPFNKSWYLRDSNWSPDFPTAAQNAQYFYNIEGGTETFDGVVGITPDFIADLLEIVGPTQVPGFPYTFTKENLTEQLEFHVEQNFVNRGIDFHERKDIISDLAQVILSKLFTLGGDELMNVAEVVQMAFMERHIVFYSNDEEIQQVFYDRGWDGSVLPATGDYVMMVDSNMASLKTDSYMERQFEYYFDETNADESSKLIATYKNNSPGLTWKTTRYRNWSRLYTPKGSEPVFISGHETDPSNYETTDTPFEVTEEHDKTSFGIFNVTQPGEQRTVEYLYDVPDDVVTNDMYTLYVQKQIGVDKPKFKARLKFERPIESFEPAKYGELISENEVEFNLDLQVDRAFVVRFK